MLISLTVGKVDAGVAVLLTEDKRLNQKSKIEFPSILLPPSICSGSIVDINVSRNFEAESKSQNEFNALQDEIFKKYGEQSPSQPVLRCRNATQTSVVLEWDPIELATAELRSLSLFRNGSKAGNIPKPLENKSTKISGLAVDTEYTFHLVLRTSAGTYSSEKLAVRTQKMTDLTGITVTPGVLPPQLRESLIAAVKRIGAKMIDTVRIDTTHFVCTEGRGNLWERAVEMNIPVVRPEWVEGCEHEGRIVGVRAYYLNADPKLRQIGQSISITQQQQQQQQQQPQQPSHQQTMSAPSQHMLSAPVEPAPKKDEPLPPTPGTPIQPEHPRSRDSVDEIQSPAKPPPNGNALPPESNELAVKDKDVDEKSVESTADVPYRSLTGNPNVDTLAEEEAHRPSNAGSFSEVPL